MARFNRQGTLQKIVDYLNENYLPDCANAVEKAGHEVALAQQGECYIQRFNRNVNKHLTEALIALNYDYEKGCPSSYLKHLRKLIEAYHEIHGLPTDDFYGGNDIEAADEVAYGQVAPEETDDWMPTDGEEYDVEEGCEEGCDMEEHILNCINVGEIRSVSSLCNVISRQTGVDDPIAILDAVKELVRQGHFEVREREPYNGTIASVMRVS